MLTLLSLAGVAGDAAPGIEVIWRQFVVLYDVVKNGLNDSISSFEQLQTELLAWLRLFFGTITGELAANGTFTSQVTSGGGYTTQDVTPYIHMFVCHSVQLLRINGPLGLYTCQGLEKLNQTSGSISVPRLVMEDELVPIAARLPLSCFSTTFVS